jgi:hypothetical protein
MSKEAYTPPALQQKEAYTPPTTTATLPNQSQAFGAVAPRPAPAITYLCAGTTPCKFFLAYGLIS